MKSTKELIQEIERACGACKYANRPMFSWPCIACTHANDFAYQKSIEENTK